MRQIWLLALNDLRLTARDRPAFLWMIVMPVAMMWFIGGIGGGSSGTLAISLGVVNHDDGWVSEALIEELTGDSVNLRIMTPEEADVAEDKVRTLVIPEGLTRGVLAGEQQVLRLEFEPDTSRQFGMAAQVHIVRAIVRVLPRLVEMKGDPATVVGDAEARAEFRRLGRAAEAGGARSLDGGGGHVGSHRLRAERARHAHHDGHDDDDDLRGRVPDNGKVGGHAAPAGHAAHGTSKAPRRQDRRARDDGRHPDRHPGARRGGSSSISTGAVRSPAWCSC